jgi:hypothetical protein
LCHLDCDILCVTGSAYKRFGSTCCLHALGVFGRNS